MRIARAALAAALALPSTATGVVWAFTAAPVPSDFAPRRASSAPPSSSRGGRWSSSAAAASSSDDSGRAAVTGAAAGGGSGSGGSGGALPQSIQTSTRNGETVVTHVDNPASAAALGPGASASRRSARRNHRRRGGAGSVGGGGGGGGGGADTSRPRQIPAAATTTTTLSDILARGTARQSLEEIIRAGVEREAEEARERARAFEAARAARARAEEAAKAAAAREKRRGRKQQRGRRGGGTSMTTNAPPPSAARPWKASYPSSSSVQRRLHNSSLQNGSALSRSVRVLRTLLDDTPPEWCNESNLVFALTLSAKLAGGARMDRATGEKRAELRGLVIRALGVLDELVAEANEEGGTRRRMSPRQLCNAAWAAGKHCRNDPQLLPKDARDGGGGLGHGGALLTSARGVTERWDLAGDSFANSGAGADASSPATDDAAENMGEGEGGNDDIVTRVMESMATALIEAMESSRSSSSSSSIVPPASSNESSPERRRRKRDAVKPGELAMAVWAYAVVRPRSTPPGWELPPRVASAGAVVEDGTAAAAAASAAAAEATQDGGLRGDIVDSLLKGEVAGASAAPGVVSSGEAVAGPPRGGEEEGVGGGNESVQDVMTFEVWDDYASKDGFGAAYSSASSPLAVEEYAEDEDEDDAEDDDVDRDEWEPSMWNSAEECSLDVVDCLYDAVAAELIRRRSATDRPPRAAELDPAALDPPPAEEEGTSLLRKCKWRDLANVAWAYASRGYAGFSRSSERMMGALSQEVARRLDIDTVGIDEAENGESGSGSGGHRSPPLPRDLSQIAWSLGVLQSDNFRLGEGLVRVTEAIGRNIVKEDGSLDGNFGPSELVQFAVALSHGRVDDDSLLRAVYREALGLLEEKENGPKRPNHHHTRPFRTWELSILLWVQARLYLTEKRGRVHPAFTAAATRTLLGRVRDAGYDANKAGLGSQEQANIAWSLTVLEGYEQTPDETAELLRAVFESSSSTHGSGAPRPIRLEHAHQLWQALFLLETDCPSAVFSDLGGDVDDGGGSAPPPASVVPPRFRSYLSSLWNSEKSRRKTSSARHRAISKTLDLMGVRHRNEHEEDIDVAIVLGGEAEWTGRGSRMGGGFARKSEEEEKSRRRVAVEFDGPSHFTRPAEGMRANPALPPSPPRALGHTVLKYRLLKRQGWTVVRVPYYEFDKIPFWASMERQRYLQRLLKTHADIRFSDVDVSEYKPNIPNRRTRFD